MNKLTFDFLTSRGFICTTALNAITILWYKWGCELQIHGDCVYCQESISPFRKLRNESDLIELEKEYGVYDMPIITNKNAKELVSLLPEGYQYHLDESIPYVKSEWNLSYSTQRGRYKITYLGELWSEGYNDQEEEYYLQSSIMEIHKYGKVKKEKDPPPPKE